MRRAAFLVAAALVAALLSAVPAGAVPGLDLTVSEGGDEAGRGVVDPTGAGQLLTTEVRPGRTAYAAFTVRNTGKAEASVTVLGDPGGRRLAVVYVDDRGDDVTDEVVAGTYEVPVPGDAKRTLVARVTVAEHLDTGSAASVWVDVVSEHGTTDRSGLRVVVPPMRVWATNFKGTLRCEATFPRRSVRPGDLTGVSMTITNLSDRVQYPFRMGFLEIHDADGRLLDDTDDLWRYGPVGGSIAPGDSVDVWAVDTRVRWPGELRIRARCAGLRLPAVRIQVASLDGDVGIQDAIERAVAVPGSPFQECPPGSAGEPTTGVLTTPDGRDCPR